MTFEAEVIAWLPQLRRYARALTGDRAWADDLVQDTAERALARWSAFRPNSNLRAWLLTDPAASVHRPAARAPRDRRRRRKRAVAIDVCSELGGKPETWQQ
ncbi:DNA-directed RNA polymerase specialized sigma24 family protein [Paraburkholderia sp. MM6662-R1]